MPRPHLLCRPVVPIAVLLASSLLVGCGNDEESQSETSAEQTEEESTGTEDSPVSGTEETEETPPASPEEEGLEEQSLAPSEERDAWLAGLDSGLKDMSNPQQGVSLSEARRHYEVVCSSCHGSRGAGDGPIADELAPPATDLTDPMRWDTLTDGQRYSAIQDGIPGTTMGPFGSAMSSEQIWNLVTLINGFVDDSRRPPEPEEETTE